MDVNSLGQLDFILITHEHEDHMHLPLVKMAAEKFPEAGIITTPSAAKILGKEGLQASTEGNEFIEVEPAQHEKVLGTAPENVLFRVFGKLTHPGDSHSFNSTTEILAMPVQAPWGSFVAAIEKAAELKPKTVIPIHDWHWRDEARKRMYEMAGEHLRKHGIKFKPVESGEAFQL